MGTSTNKFSCLIPTIAAVFGFASSLQAEVKLPALFTDNGVLQRGKPIPIWGWGKDGEQIQVKFKGHTALTVARDGKWFVTLPEQKAGGPYDLTVKGDNEITLTNILVGEVWICSGQSNMEWPLTRTEAPEKALKKAKNKEIRLFTVPKLKAAEPVDDVKSSWELCNSNTIQNFSAVAYYFGRELEDELDVPVGLIHTSWGGSPAEVWMREEILAENPLYKADIVEPTHAAGHNGWKSSELYNGMIAPLIPYAIQGAIWYQGESNAGKAHQYRTLFPDMISNWRLDFQQGDFPFLAVQLAPWDKNKKRDLEVIASEIVESDWAELREAQLLATKVLPNVGLAVITDAGDKDDIHPMDKEPVGERLALAALGIAYDEDITWSGPVYKNMVIENGKAIIEFDHVGRGLRAEGGSLKGFTIAGPDRNFVWANAEIKGDKVIVSSPSVPKPAAVRYGWADYPVVNLFNKAGLPATPFRTDNFPMLTGPRLVVKK